MGSGSVPAYGILESGYKDNLTVEEAQNLAINAIKAGILYDLGSGSNVDFVILQKGKTDYFRNFEIVGQKMLKIERPYRFVHDDIRFLISRVET
jgi:20S proteasome subunit beta 2